MKKLLLVLVLSCLFGNFSTGKWNPVTQRFDLKDNTGVNGGYVIRDYFNKNKLKVYNGLGTYRGYGRWNDVMSRWDYVKEGF